MCNKETNIWKAAIAFQVLVFIGPAIGYVTPSQDACIWGIPTSELAMRTDSVISQASLTLTNVRSNPDCPNPILYINLLKNAEPGFHQIPDNMPGNRFVEYGSCLKIILPAGLSQQGQDLTVPLHLLTMPNSWVWKKFDQPFNMNLPNGMLFHGSGAILELMDAAGSSPAFGFGIDTDGFYFDTLILEVAKDSLHQDLPSESVSFTYQNRSAPIMINTADRQITAGQILTFQVFVLDLDQNHVRCTAANLPPGAVFENNIFRWTPGTDHIGTWTMALTATDGVMTTTKQIRIEVIPQNNPPVFDPMPPAVIDERQTLTISVVARDPDGDPVSVTAENLPPGAKFNGTTFSWRPWYEQAGQYTVLFNASDGQAKQTKAFSITVRPIPLPSWYEDWKRTNGSVVYY